MNDAEYSFFEDVRKGRRMAASSHHKVNGVRSKKCTLASDYLTQSQINKLHGEVEVYRLGSPMRWNEFRAMPLDLQEQYLAKLVDKYEVRTPQLAKMFGISREYVLHYIKNHDFPSVKIFPVGTRIPDEKLLEWDAFIKQLDNLGVNTEDEPVKMELESPSTIVVDPVASSPLRENASVTKDVEKVVPTTCIHHLDIGYEGEIDLGDVVAYLQLVLGDKFTGHLEIKFTK